MVKLSYHDFLPHCGGAGVSEKWPCGALCANNAGCRNPRQQYRPCATDEKFNILVWNIPIRKPGIPATFLCRQIHSR